MSEKIPKVRFRDGEQSDITIGIHRMIKRYIYAEPFPLTDDETVEMIHSTLPDDITKKLNLLQDFDATMVESSNSVNIRISGATGGLTDHKIYLHDAGGDTKFYISSMRILQPNSPHYAKVVAWADEVAMRKQTTDTFSHHITRVFYHCNTPGQVKTIYPALVELLPHRMKSALKKSTRATRWPDALLREREIFMAESKAQENMIVLLKMVSNHTPIYTRFTIDVNKR